MERKTENRKKRRPRKKKKAFEALVFRHFEGGRARAVGSGKGMGEIWRAGIEAYDGLERAAKENGLGSFLLDREYFVQTRMKALKRSRAFRPKRNKAL